MGIENCRVLGTESGRVGPLSRGGSVATGAGRPPGSAGVSPAFVSAQPGPSPQPGSTGNRARALLWPGSRRSRRRRGQVHHRRRSARYATAVHAGETPALPGGASLSQCSRLSPALLLQPDSTGSRARALLRTGSRRSCPRGWPVHRRRRSARYATAVHAGETPALPGGVFLPQCSRLSPALLLQPDSTGSRARALLWPRTRRSCRRGWPVHHRRRSARYATAVQAGETPALPGGASLSQCSRLSLALLLQRDSTGSRARALLWPGSRRSCRRGWPVHHRRRSARYATAVYAGETPALPGGASLSQCSRLSPALLLQPDSTGSRARALLWPRTRRSCRRGRRERTALPERHDTAHTPLLRTHRAPTYRPAGAIPSTITW